MDWARVSKVLRSLGTMSSPSLPRCHLWNEETRRKGGEGPLFAQRIHLCLPVKGRPAGLGQRTQGGRQAGSVISSGGEGEHNAKVKPPGQPPPLPFIPPQSPSPPSSHPCSPKGTERNNRWGSCQPIRERGRGRGRQTCIFPAEQQGSQWTQKRSGKGLGAAC